MNMTKEQATEIERNAIKEAQKIIAEWFVPFSNIPDKEVLNRLIGILDTQTLVKAQMLLDGASEP